MDIYRGYSSEDTDEDAAAGGAESREDETHREAPPLAIGQDERRMQVRAYNHWAGQLDGRNYPSIESLEPESLTDFGPYSVLLDFTAGIEDPAVQYLGDRLAAECTAEGPIKRLSDVPSRSLLSRITDHYMQILANQAPIGFEAEFVNAQGVTVAYRGILLPYSSDDDTIDFIYGVINWKELADQKTTDDLMQAIDQALEPKTAAEPLTGWADGPDSPAGAAGEEHHNDSDDEGAASDDGVLDLVTPLDGDDESAPLPEPLFGASSEPASAESDDTFELAAHFEEEVFELDAASETLQGADEVPALEELGAGLDPTAMELGDWLASARELAQAAKGSEDRTRQALYAAIGRAYDFALAAAAAPEDFAEIVAESGLTVQERAPMTPVVKLVFGADYDKTRLTEYASALSHAQRLGLARGELADYLATAPGGLKGVVTEERRLRREEAGKPVASRDAPREALARKLRRLGHTPLAAVAASGSEFTLLVARRLPTGEVVLLGEVADDVPLLERAARKLLN
jgi:hypothetical protein